MGNEAVGWVHMCVRGSRRGCECVDVGGKGGEVDALCNSWAGLIAASNYQPVAMGGMRPCPAHHPIIPFEK